MASGRACALLIGAVLLAPAAARADADVPWGVGVSAENRAKAMAELDAANALMRDKKYVEALDRYSTALRLWDHPVIRFRIAQCLVQLDRVLDAYDSLEKALAYGSAPFESADYKEALSYQKLLTSNLAEVSVRCSQTGVTLSFDGKPLAVCPAQKSERTEPGQHQLVAAGPGYRTKAIDVDLRPAAHETLDVHLDPLGDVGGSEHRTAWIPYAVLGAGLAVGATGGYVELGTSHDGVLGVSMLAVGGLGVGAGIVMLVLDRDDPPPHVQVSPAPNGGSVSWTGRF